MDFYINEQTLSWFSLFLGNFLIFSFLLSLKTKSKAATELTWFFGFLMGLYLSTVYQSSTVSFDFFHSLQRRIQLIFPIISMAFLLRFAVLYPRSIKEWSILQYILNRIGFVTVPITLGFIGYSLWRPDTTEDVFLFSIVCIIGFKTLLLIFLFFAKERFFKKHKEDHHAKSIQVFFKPFSLILFAIGVEVSHILGWIPEIVEAPALSTTLQVFQFYFIFTFINQSQIKTTVINRILAVMFFAFLTILGSSGHYLMNILRKDFAKSIPISPQTTVKFQKSGEQYTIQKIPYHYSSELGYCFEADHKTSVEFRLPFPFPFFNKTHSVIQSFSQPLLVFSEKAFYYRFDLGLFFPAMVPLQIYSVGQLDSDAFVCIERSKEFIRISWEGIRMKGESIYTDQRISVQVELYPNGDFIWTYKNLYPLQRVFGHNWSTSLDLIGIFLGNLDSGKGNFDFNQEEPQTSEPGKSVSLDLQRYFLYYVHNRISSLFWVMCSFYLITFFVFPVYLKKNLVEPLLQVVASIQRVADGIYETKIKPKFNDEIGFISTAFNIMQSSLKKNVELQKEKNKIQEENLHLVRNQNLLLEEKVQERTSELNKRNQILEKDLKMARKIQEKILPNLSSVEGIASFYEPMDQVGGDFFDLISFREPGRFGIFLCDVSGHGVASAFITSMIKMSLLQAGDRKENPKELMEYLNEMLFDNTAGHFVTAFYAIFDNKKKIIEYTNAGHLPPFVVQKSGIRELESGICSGIGMFSNQSLIERGLPFSVQSQPFGNGDRAFLYTDGIIEVENWNNPMEFFPKEEIQAFLWKYREKPLQDSLDSLFQEVAKYHGSYKFQDDICMVYISS